MFGPPPRQGPPDEELPVDELIEPLDELRPLDELIEPLELVLPPLDPELLDPAPPAPPEHPAQAPKLLPSALQTWMPFGSPAGQAQDCCAPATHELDPAPDDVPWNKGELPVPQAAINKARGAR